MTLNSRGKYCCIGDERGVCVVFGNIIWVVCDANTMHLDVKDDLIVVRSNPCRNGGIVEQVEIVEAER